MREFVLFLLLVLPLPSLTSPLQHLLASLVTSDNYRQAQAGVLAAEQSIAISQAVRKPQLRSTVSYRLDEPSAPGTQETQRLNNSLILTQELYNQASLQAVTISKLQLDLAQARATTIRQQVMLGAYRAYLATSLAQESLLILRQRRTNLNEQMRFATTAFEVGKTSRLDILNVRAQLAALKAERISARGNLAIVQSNLASISGKSALVIQRLQKPPAVPTGKLDDWLFRADKSPQVLTTEIEIKIQEAITQQLRGKILPSLGIRGTSDLDSDHRLSLELSIPLFSSGGATTTLARSRIQQQGLVAARDAARVASRLSASNAWENLSRQHERSDALADSVAIAAERLDLAEASIQLQDGILADALRAEADLATAELQLLQSRHAQLDAWLSLLFATGEFSIEQITLLEKLFV